MCVDGRVVTETGWGVGGGAATDRSEWMLTTWKLTSAYLGARSVWGSLYVC